MKYMLGAKIKKVEKFWWLQNELCSFILPEQMQEVIRVFCATFRETVGV